MTTYKSQPSRAASVSPIRLTAGSIQANVFTPSLPSRLARSRSCCLRVRHDCGRHGCRQTLENRAVNAELCLVVLKSCTSEYPGGLILACDAGFGTSNTEYALSGGVAGSCAVRHTTVKMSTPVPSQPVALLIHCFDNPCVPVEDGGGADAFGRCRIREICATARFAMAKRGQRCAAVDEKSATA